MGDVWKLLKSRGSERNVGLAILIGISSEKEVSKVWSPSWFLEELERELHRSHLREMFAERIRCLDQTMYRLRPAKITRQHK